MHFKYEVVNNNHSEAISLSSKAFQIAIHIGIHTLVVLIAKDG